MVKKAGKEIPQEKQREILREAFALKLPQLRQSLITVYGEEKGRKIYDDVFEVNFKMRAKQFEGKDVGDIMMAEIDMLPTFGWKIWIDKKEEAGEPVWYEHMEKCPHLDATNKYKLPLPCDILCDMDAKLAEKFKVAKWERLKHMPSGDNECCFKVTRFK